MGSVSSSTSSALKKNTVEKVEDLKLLHSSSSTYEEIIAAINVLIKDYKGRYSLE